MFCGFWGRHCHTQRPVLGAKQADMQLDTKIMDLASMIAGASVPGLIYRPATAAGEDISLPRYSKGYLCSTERMTAVMTHFMNSLRCYGLKL